jgi:hypothetical protein
VTRLGDSHNFGRHVELRGKRVAKPRTLLWEWLLLSADSPLRRYLKEATGEAFEFLPTLKFQRPRAKSGGEVERLVLKPLPAPSLKRKNELAAIVGSSLALFSWLGIADLHWENLVLGSDGRGRVIFGPLDVEMILADFSRPTETKLLPDADPEYAELCRHASGVRRVLPYLGKPIAARDLLAMADAYLAALALLDRHSAEIAALFAKLPGLRETPIRLILRSTGDYVRAATQPVWPPLLDAELEQMARGDIPYFFRLYGRPGIHYYANRALTQLERLPLRGDVPTLDPILQLSRGLRSPSRRRLQGEGLFTLLGAFDHSSFAGTFQHGELAVTFKPRSLVIGLPGGEELESKRDLSAFVGSVYLPCRCGEVRSVFVPPVTVCKA